MSTEYFRQSANFSTNFLLAQDAPPGNESVGGNSPSPETATGGITVAAVVIGGALLFIGKKFVEGAASRAGEDAYDRMSKRRKRK